MDDRELCVLIDRQSRQAIGADDLTDVQRDDAYAYYYGEAKGRLAASEIDGRSRVVSKDLMDTVEWAMPALMDTFASADDIVRFEPDSPEDEQACMDATNYIGFLIHRKNEDGFTTIHDAVKSSLIARTGWGKCYVEEAQDYRQERYSGLTQQEVQILEGDPEIEIVEQYETGMVPAPVPPQPGQPPQLVPLFDVVCRRAENVTQFRNEGVPPEEIRVSKETRVLSDCHFIEHRREVTLSYLREQGYEESQIAQLASDQMSRYSDNEAARMDYDDTDPLRNEPIDESQRKVWLSESYLRVDFDGDGKTEYRRVVKVLSVIFENDVVDDHPFWLMSPILMPYKIQGLSMYDLVEDLQQIKTSLTREVLNNAYLANNPMKEVVENGIIDMDELLTPRVGGIVRVKAAGTIREIMTPSIAAQGLELMNRFDEIRDTRTGVTEMNSAMNTESLSQTNVGSQGVQALMNAGVQRIRLIARVLAETGFKRMYYLMLKNVTQHQDKSQQVKINGRWLTIDPREWKNRYNMTVSVGVGTFGRQQQVQNMQMVMGMQQQLLQLGMVQPQNVFNAAKRLVEAMGYRDADQFITLPQSGQQQGQQKDPVAQAAEAQAQALIQAEQVKAQASLQKAQMDNQTRLVVEREKIQSTERVAMFEAENKQRLEEQKMLAQAAQANARAMQPRQGPQQ
mgnify:CR=1 FL=1